MTVTAVVIAKPPSIRDPKIPTGQTRLQFIIRLNRHSWTIFVDDVSRELGLTSATKAVLLESALRMEQIGNLQLRRRIQQWFSHFWPTDIRTLEGLSSVRNFLT